MSMRCYHCLEIINHCGPAMENTGDGAEFCSLQCWLNFYLKNYGHDIALQFEIYRERDEFDVWYEYPLSAARLRWQNLER